MVTFGGLSLLFVMFVVVVVFWWFGWGLIWVFGLRSFAGVDLRLCYRFVYGGLPLFCSLLYCWCWFCYFVCLMPAVWWLVSVVACGLEFCGCLFLQVMLFGYWIWFVGLLF